MEKLKLTKQERLILANQNRILALLNEDNPDTYNYNAEIAERGYEGLYHELFSNLGEGVSHEVCEETHEILTMYRVINGGISGLTNEQSDSIDLEKIKFEGFDANNDDHYRLMEFMIEEGGLYKELKEMYRNSHNSWTISKYRKLLGYYNQVKKASNYTLDFENLKAMVELI